MKVNINKSNLFGEIQAISSKSVAHRTLICSALSKGEETKVYNLTPSEDVSATISALSTLGAKIDLATNTVIAPNVFLDGLMDVNECGSTLRFMLPISAALSGEYLFVTRGKLAERPNDELLKVLVEHGIEVTKTKYIKLKGTLSGGLFKIRGDISSQYVSGLLMALPLLPTDSEIVLTTLLSSKDYVEITIDIMEKFGVKVEKKLNVYKIKGGQKYTSPKEINVEGDWSNSAFWIVAGVTNGEIKLTNLNLDSKQGDKKIVEIIQKMGGDIKIYEDSIIARKSNLNSIDLFVDDIPDMVPALAVAAANAKGRSVFRNINRLKMKESDRVLSIIKMLESVGVRAFEKNDNLYVEGGEIKSGEIDSYNDHRIAMSGAVLLLNCGGKIINSQAVNKSYPNFFEDLKKLKGEVNVEN